MKPTVEVPKGHRFFSGAMELLRLSQLSFLGDDMTLGHQTQHLNLVLEQRFQILTPRGHD